MLMGDVCTRGCRFCAVTSGRPRPLDPEEPENLARAIGELDLTYAVITSVDRDDLPDGGASHFAACIRAVRKYAPETLVEVLIPDFLGDEDALRLIVESEPDVVAHNVETVARLTASVRDARCGYDLSLRVLRTLKEAGAGHTKSSIMTGLGEREEEVLAAMSDLRDARVDILTLGQYLRPSLRHVAVTEYVHPDQFERYREAGEKLGFLYVASGPLVRSSYRAGELFLEGALREGGGRQAEGGSSS